MQNNTDFTFCHIKIESSLTWTCRIMTEIRPRVHFLSDRISYTPSKSDRSRWIPSLLSRLTSNASLTFSICDAVNLSHFFSLSNVQLVPELGDKYRFPKPDNVFFIVYDDKETLCFSTQALAHLLLNPSCTQQRCNKWNHNVKLWRSSTFVPNQPV